MRASDTRSASFDLLNEIDGGVVVLDAEHRVRHWNAWMRNGSGFASDEVLGRPLWEAFPALGASHLQAAVEDALVSGAPSILSHTLHPLLFPLRCRDGRAMLHDVTVLPLSVRSAAHCLVQVKDVTERRRMQVALLESRARYRAAFEHAAIGIAECDLTGRFLQVNDRLRAILGRDRDELLGLRFQDITHPDDLDNDLALMRGMLAGELGTCCTEKRFLDRDGGAIWVNVTGSLVPGSDGRQAYIVATIEDISGRKKVEVEREQLLVQKDMLTREAHHRVKNSLALAVSLLSVQSHKVTDEVAREQVLSAQHRVMAIARLHDRLHRSDDLEQVEIGLLLRELCSDLEAAVAIEAGRYCILTDVSAEVALPIDQALPLAIIVSELVTNALRHARPDGTPVEVVVGCHRTETGGLRISVADDGAGLPPDFDPARDGGLGLTILVRLCEQLSARLEIPRTGRGAEFVLHFQADGLAG